MNENNYDLKPLWTAMYDIYREMRKICEKHHLRMYASSGTALGAVRHGGFIPWDDDFDVCMPRKDYDIFLKIADSELPEHLRVLSWRNCPKYMNLFSKVIIIDRNIVSDVSLASRLPINGGIFVDIFPIDGYPDSWIWKHVRILAVGFSRWLLKVTKRPSCIGFMEWVCSRADFEKSANVLEWGGWVVREKKFCHVKSEDLMSWQSFGKGCKFKFMDGDVVLPADYERYLRLNYGNYMELPPVEKRVPDHASGRVKEQPWRFGPNC